jgi:flagellar hook-length control protein FliK
MAPNLLPFAASVTNGVGTSKSGPAAAGTGGSTGFAELLKPAPDPASLLPVTPVAGTTAPGSPLLGLVEGDPAAPTETALPEQLAIDIPPLAPAVAPLPEAAAIPAGALQTGEQLLAQPEMLAPADGLPPTAAPAGGMATTVEPVRKDDPLPAKPEPQPGSVTVTEPTRKPVGEVVKPTPEPGTVTTTEPTRKPVDAVVKPTPEPGGVTVTEPTRKPVGAVVKPTHDPDSVTVTEPTRKPVGAVVKPTHDPDSVTVTEPTRKPVGAVNKPAPEPGSVAVTEPVRKPVVATDEAPVPDTQPLSAPAVEAAVALAAPALAPLDGQPDAAAATPTPHSAEAAPPSVAATASGVAPTIPAPATPATAPNDPTRAPEPVASASAQRAAPAPQAADLQRPEPVADLPMETDQQDNTPLADAAPTDAMPRDATLAGDGMNRDSNRQQPAPTPAPAQGQAQAVAGPVQPFDMLAALEQASSPPATDPSEPTHRARAAAIGEDVGLAIVRHTESGSGDVLIIRLDPAELGKIEVRLRMDEAKQLSAEVTADQPATLDLLRRDADNLTRALNDAGFRADDQSLRFDSRGFGQGEQQAQQGRRLATRAYLADADAASAQSALSPVQVRSAGRVDLVA